MKILVINSGSSSIKYRLYNMPSEEIVLRGMIERIGERNSKVKNHHQGLELILSKVGEVDAVGHRVVHGGEFFKRPSLINSRVVRVIKLCCKLAPLHNPANLEGINACRQLLPGIKQAAVFDTAFHQSIPGYAFIYALPFSYYKKLGIRRYGFHGTSHQYVTNEAAKILRKPLNRVNIISCHLGNGCSITAVKSGKSVDTSMGFTPLEGLVMGTRCGDIDPALVTFIMRRKKMGREEMERVLNKESGLKGLSGIGNDMRRIEEAARRGSKQAALALDVFIYRIRKYIGAYLAAIGNTDAVVFTAGIGENQGYIRARICRNLFDNLKNRPRVLVIPTDEELMIARETYKIIGSRQGGMER
ncbi:MAG: acetate kinase [Candidatus Omnitrophica bacterium]|nr:acetate kinase [Candidatus Omnitrophota bacterium]